MTGSDAKLVDRTIWIDAAPQAVFELTFIDFITEVFRFVPGCIAWRLLN